MAPPPKEAKPFHMQEHTNLNEHSPGTIDAHHVKLGQFHDHPQPYTDCVEYNASGQGLDSSARLTDDGRISISLDLKKHLPDLPEDHAKDVREFALDEKGWNEVPAMNVLIMIVGSRGDVQPYLAFGKLLVKDGHRVRIATHNTFRSFVKEAGLEFFDIGGNPHDLMSYMVKNPGLIPGMESLTNGDIGRKRAMLKEMIEGCWKACYEPCSETGRPFAVDAIVSNPPAFAHIHCAEALGVPLLLSFTMPWSPTSSFPHPLVNINHSNAEARLTNYLTYALADILIWQGVGDIVNSFRANTLGLKRLSLRSGPGLVDNLKIPWTYCMSPALVHKPCDWKSHIDVVGFYFLDLAGTYHPSNDLVEFLAAGPPPVYIGFGSVVVDNPAAMTEIIFSATKQANVRALVAPGWGGLGGISVPSHVFLLDNIPHDWLFDQGRVSAVVHHGGAGTTAVGLKYGRPTVIVPFFGDQDFWGSMIHKTGAGPKPIPHKELRIENLRDAINFATSAKAAAAAAEIAESIRNEDGTRQGVDSFYRHMPLLNMRCDLEPSLLAVWWSTQWCLKLSAFAAQTLVDAKQLDIDGLEPHRSKAYEAHKKVSDPLTGGASAIFWTVTHWYGGIAQIFYSPVKGIINATTAIPKGILDIFMSVQEGMHNLPKLYGSEVRPQGPVTGVKSGFKEAGKGFFYGYLDGITGLVSEPLEGAKKEGFIGAVKGSGRSFINATMRPAAGILGLVSHPLHGAWEEAKCMFHGKELVTLRGTRISDGVGAVLHSSSEQRAEILVKFEEAKIHTSERQEVYRDMAKQLLEENAASPSRLNLSHSHS